MGADGRALKRLTPWSLDAPNADWSPDASRLLFHTYSDEHPGKSAQAVGPSWSPDGTRIVWHEVSPSVDQLFVMDARGGHVRKLTHLPAETSPSRAAWGTAAG